MVFKKPYAFLIKHFKAIHLALCAILVYLAYRVFRIVKFFSEFASSGYYSSISNIAGTHINLFMYLAVIVALCISIFIYMLMKNKKKNTKLYVGLIAYYILVFILFSVTFGIMQGLERNVADAQLARLYRDLSLLFSLPQYFFVVCTFLRGCGFNLKQFNFQLDLKEMEIEATDDEEIELTVGVETYKAKRYLRRFLREFKYYFKENTFIFLCIVSIVGIIIGTGIFMNVNVYNKVYNENKVFAYKSFSMKVNESYLTNTDYRGEEVIPGKYYLVINMNIVNKSTAATAIDLTDFRLKINNQTLYPTKSKIEYFADLGMPYKEDKLKGGSEGDYILIYELDKKELRNSYVINALENINYNVGDIKANYKKIRVNPKKIEEVEKGKTYKQQEKITFKDSILGDSSLKIKSYNITDSYKYDYKFCLTDDDCRDSVGIVTPKYTISSNSTLLVLDYELTLDETTAYYRNNKTDKAFFNQFCKIRYNSGDETITETATNLTPNELEGKVVLQVDKSIKNSKNVDLVLSVRNKEYSVKIK